MLIASFLYAFSVIRFVPSIFLLTLNKSAFKPRGSQLGRQVYETPESVSDSGVNFEDSGVNIKDSGISGVNFLNHMTS
jgi:hypothetical protein